MNKGTTNVTITDDVVAGGTVTFAAVDGAAGGEKGFNITSTANNNSIAVVGGGLADTIVAGTGDETLNGSAGADTITGGTGKDDFLLYNMGATDVIKDFTVSQTDQFGVDLSDMEAQALTDFVGLDAVSVAADQAMNTLIVNATAAVDLNGTDTRKEIAVFSGDYADETGALLRQISATRRCRKLLMLSLVFTTMALTPSWLVLKQLAVLTMPCSMTLTLSSWRNSRVSRMQRLLSTQTSSPRLPDLT